MTPDYYALLEVAPEADTDVIRAAYLVLARRYHPDTATAASPHNDEKFKLVTEAYEVLHDPDSRARYHLHYTREKRYAVWRQEFDARHLARELALKKRHVARNALVLSFGMLAMAALVFVLVEARSPNGFHTNVDLAVLTEKFNPSPELNDKKAQNRELTELLLEADGRVATYKALFERARARNRSLEEQLATLRGHDVPTRLPAPAEPSETAEIDKLATSLLSANDKPATPASDWPKVTMARPTAPEAANNPQLAHILARAGLLLDRGLIGAAQKVLERAAEMGSTSALFQLAETYDPAILSTWRSSGAQADFGKAQELYARAFAGGVREAKDRLNASP